MMWNEDTISWVFMEKMVLEEDIKEIFDFIQLGDLYLAKYWRRSLFEDVISIFF